MYQMERAGSKGSASFSAEYQAQVVAAFLASGKTVAVVAREFGLPAPTVWQWIRQASEAAAGTGPAGPERHASPSCQPTGTESAEEQAEALTMFQSGGKTIAEIAYKLNLAESTVREWIWHAPFDVAPGPAPVRERVAEALIPVDDPTFVPEVLESEFEDGLAAETAAKPGRAKAEAGKQAGAAAAAAEAKAAEAESKAAKAIRARARAEKKAAEALARAEAAAESEASARVEITAVYAAAVEAMIRSEVSAAEAVAQAEVAAATKVAQAEVAARVLVEEAARAEIAVVYAQAVEAIVRAEVEAAEKVARAEAAAAEAQAAAAEAAALAKSEGAARLVAEEAARSEIAVAYAAAVEAVERAEVEAAEKVAGAQTAVAEAEEAAAEAEAAAADSASRCEALAEAVARFEAAAAEARAAAKSEAATRVAAEEAARAEIAAAYAAAVEAMVRVQVEAAEKVACAEAAAAQAVARAQTATAAAMARQDAVRTHATVRSEAVQVTPVACVATASPEAVAPEVAPLEADVSGRPADESSARAEIAQLVSRLEPIEVWVQATGRTVAEAREAALEKLGVDEAEAEIEVLDKASRWLPGRVRIRARVRVADSTRPPGPATGGNASSQKVFLGCHPGASSPPLPHTAQHD